MTKDDELQALQALATELGPNTYLGPWLSDALPWLADQIRRDYAPQHARAMADEAARVRVEAYTNAQTLRAEASLEARITLEKARATAAELIQEAEAKADQIRSAAWQAIRTATRALEA